MKPNIYFNSNNNQYFFNYHFNQIFICHPVFKYIAELDYKGNNTELKNIIKKGVQIPGHGFYRKEIVNYYKKKYDFLKQAGFVDPLETNIEKAFISKENILDNIKNLPGLIFETTQDCNLSCEYCCFESNYIENISRNNKNLDVNTVKICLDYFLRKREDHISPFEIGFYGGEPLINFKLIEKTISYLEKKYVNKFTFNYQMTTNGILLKKYIDYLVEKGFDISISLDGDQCHNSYRRFKNGKYSFPILINIIKDIKCKYPSYFEQNISFTCTYHNKSNLNEIINFFKDEFGLEDNVMVSSLNLAGLNPDNEKKFKETYFKEINRDYNLLKNKTQNAHFYFDNGSTISFLKDFSGFNYITPRNYIANKVIKKLSCACIPYSKSPLLTSSGKLIPCTFISQNEDIGKINNNTVEINYQKIIDKYNQLTDKTRNKCNSCYNFRWCDNCVFTEANKDTECSGYMEANRIKEYLENEISVLENIGPMIEQF